MNCTLYPRNGASAIRAASAEFTVDHAPPTVGALSPAITEDVGISYAFNYTSEEMGTANIRARVRSVPPRSHPLYPPIARSPPP